MSIKDTTNEYISSTYARYELELVSGRGCEATDTAGRTYIDMGSGIGVNSLGYCDPEWTSAVAKQAGTLNHTSNLYYTEPGAVLSETLCKASGFSRVFFCNSGAEANEGAIKAARKYSSDKYGAERYEIVALDGSFHGRTITTLSATGQSVFHKHFNPFTEGFTHAKPNDIEDLKAKLSEKTCAVMIEFIQGEGGVVPLDEDYVQSIFSICREKDILVIADEVQTGIGRTGTLFCCEQYGVTPDIVSSAKGLGGGLPIGAVLFNERTAGVFGASDHGTTYGANPIACAGANVVLKRLLSDGFLEEVAKKGQYIRDKVSPFPHVKEVRGKGLMIGVELDKIAAADVVKRAMTIGDSGAIFLTAKTVLRMLPPLVITYEEIDRALNVLLLVLSEI